MNVNTSNLPSSIGDLVCFPDSFFFLQCCSLGSCSNLANLFALLQVFPTRLAWIVSFASEAPIKMLALRQLSEPGDLLLPQSEQVGPDVLYRLDASTLVVFSCRYTPKSGSKADAYRYLLPPELTWFPTATSQNSELREFMKPIKRIIVRLVRLCYVPPLLC
jgi:hypothetical protein